MPADPLDPSTVPAVVTGLRGALPVTPAATTSRALIDNDAVRIVMFTFDTAERLTEHTASMPAVLILIEGAMDLVLGEEVHALEPGDCAYLPAHAPHSLEARSPSRLSLQLLRRA